VGDDACLILWDARTGTSPAVKVTLFSILDQQRLVQQLQKGMGLTTFCAEV
jgi:hypothetical protein